MVNRYKAVCIQPDIRFAKPGSPKKAIRANLKRDLDLIDHTFNYALFSMGAPIKIIAFPEWFLQGSHFKSLDDFRKIGISIPGEETDKLADKAKEYDIYICGHVTETDQEWPKHFFSTAFIIDPKGKIALRYRKLSTTNMMLTLATSPHDILNKYEEEVFPTITTPIGRLACLISWDRYFPEIARAYALKGAEVLLMPSVFMEPWGSTPFEWWTMVNRVRAFENISYIVAPNAAWVLNTDHPRSYSFGHSQIIDFQGKILAQTNSSNETIVTAEIDIDRLRETRNNAPYNFLAQIRTEAFSPIYEKTVYPPNQWLKKSPESYLEIEKGFETAKKNLKKINKSR